jgi:hypothetical protein
MIQDDIFKNVYNMQHKLEMKWKCGYIFLKTPQKILNYVTIQFATICDYLSFAIMFYNFYN